MWKSVQHCLSFDFLVDLCVSNSPDVSDQFVDMSLGKLSIQM